MRRAFLISPLGPFKVTVSLQAYWPGWIKSRMLVGLAPAPKSFSNVSWVQCQWRLETLTVMGFFSRSILCISFSATSPARSSDMGLGGLVFDDPLEIFG